MSETLPEKVKLLYDKFGQRKQMGIASASVDRPHFFLHRQFTGDQDLLIIFNSKRCRYQCSFCDLPMKNSDAFIEYESILNQFEYVIQEMKNSLSMLTRITLSNDGSILDPRTFPSECLNVIADCINELRQIRRVVLETRIEFVDPLLVKKIGDRCSKSTIDILVGFETYDEYIKTKILKKMEPLNLFLNGLDKVAESGAELTSYILYKPSYEMNDEEAFIEACKTYEFLKRECEKRSIKLSVRLNPMYAAANSQWANLALKNKNYNPPKLTEVMKLAELIRMDKVSVYIGLSTEGLDIPNGNYMFREDYSTKLIKPIKLFNDSKIDSFSGYI